MKKNVLLFEKQENLRRLYKSMLSKDFQVNTASTPHEVLARVKMGQIPEAIVVNFHGILMDDAMSFLHLYQHSEYIACIPLFMVAPGPTLEFEAALSKTPLHKVPEATQLTGALREFFVRTAIPRLKPKEVSQTLPAPVAWS